MSSYVHMLAALATELNQIAETHGSYVLTLACVYFNFINNLTIR